MTITTEPLGNNISGRGSSTSNSSNGSAGNGTSAGGVEAAAGRVLIATLFLPVSVVSRSRLASLKNGSAALNSAWAPGTGEMAAAAPTTPSTATSLSNTSVTSDTTTSAATPIRAHHGTQQQHQQHSPPSPACATSTAGTASATRRRRSSFSLLVKSRQPDSLFDHALSPVKHKQQQQQQQQSAATTTAAPAPVTYPSTHVADSSSITGQTRDVTPDSLSYSLSPESSPDDLSSYPIHPGQTIDNHQQQQHQQQQATSSNSDHGAFSGDGGGSGVVAGRAKMSLLQSRAENIRAAASFAAAQHQLPRSSTSTSAHIHAHPPGTVSSADHPSPPLLPSAITKSGSANSGLDAGMAGLAAIGKSVSLSGGSGSFEAHRSSFALSVSEERLRIDTSLASAGRSASKESVHGGVGGVGSVNSAELPCESAVIPLEPYPTRYMYDRHVPPEPIPEPQLSPPPIAVEFPATTPETVTSSVAETLNPYVTMPLGSGNIGLHNAVNASPEAYGSRVWVGTLGSKVDHYDSESREAISECLGEDMVPVFPPDAMLDKHYTRFCKQILWPLFHYVLPEYPQTLGWEPDAWEACKAVATHFADVIVENYREGDLIWVNDYHLCLLPAMLRSRLPRATIGFFLHIPFPSSEIFRCLHVRRELLEGMLAADLVGFQTYAFQRHFLQTVSRVLRYETSPMAVQLDATSCAVGTFPIGIDVKTLRAKLANPEVAEAANVLRERYAGKAIVVGRDKLDSVKGVRQKMLAFEQFLAEFPEWVGRVVLIQVALSTTEKNELQGQVTDVVARINSRYGSISYQPVVYLHQDIPFSQYLALLTAADACLITSLRDGMNLTSHEYIVSQHERHGPLIMSEFAGTYGTIGAGAIRVNPWDRRQVARAINTALTMTQHEKQVRWTELYRHVCTNTAQNWVSAFVGELNRLGTDAARRHGASIVPRLTVRALRPHFMAAQRRLILLSYDGTLVPFSTRERDLINQQQQHQQHQLTTPSNIVTERLLRQRGSVSSLDGSNSSPMSPFLGSTGSALGSTVGSPVVSDGRALSAELVLSMLASDPRNIVYVASGRRRQVLEDRLSCIPRLGLACENGCFLRPAVPAPSADDDVVVGGGDDVSQQVPEWLRLVPEDASREWQDPIRKILNYYCERTPGTEVEVKEESMVWHYRSADNPGYGEWQASECMNHIQDILERVYPIHVLPGQKTLEIMPKAVSKSTVARTILDLHPDVDMVLCIGTGRMDEDVFELLNSRATSAVAAAASAASSDGLKPHLPQMIVTAAIGRLRTKAAYYLSGVNGVLELLAGLSSLGTPQSATSSMAGQPLPPSTVGLYPLPTLQELPSIVLE